MRGMLCDRSGIYLRSAQVKAGVIAQMLNALPWFYPDTTLPGAEAPGYIDKAP